MLNITELSVTFTEYNNLVSHYWHQNPTHARTQQHTRAHTHIHTIRVPPFTPLLKFQYRLSQECNFHQITRVFMRTHPLRMYIHSQSVIFIYPLQLQHFPWIFSNLVLCSYSNILHAKMKKYNIFMKMLRSYSNESREHIRIERILCMNIWFLQSEFA